MPSDLLLCEPGLSASAAEGGVRTDHGTSIGAKKEAFHDLSAYHQFPTKGASCLNPARWIAGL